MTTKITVGSKVAPRGWTKNALTYGYVRNECLSPDEVCVYWPEIKCMGIWPKKDLILKAPAKK